MSSSRSATPIATAASLDHLVLTVRSIPASVTFYETYLGMTHVEFTPSAIPSNPHPTTRHALNFGTQKINLHEHGNEFEPKADSVAPGSADLCFLIQDDVDEVLERLNRDGEVKVLEGGKVVERTGARGAIRSVYIRDPDGNLIELSNLVEKP